MSRAVTATRLSWCATLTKQLIDRVERSYVFAKLPEESKDAYLLAVKSLIVAQEAFRLLAEYEEER